MPVSSHLISQTIKQPLINNKNVTISSKNLSVYPNVQIENF